ncbi:hypothetical protein E2320_000125 [Naja naja]|nr:hypothetical protein E2320_000125 [Naja naja]
MLKIHIIFDPGYSLRSYPKSLDFEKYFIFMFPRVENVENPLHFRFELFLRTYPKAYLKMVGRTQFRQKTLLLKQSSDFEKHFIFIFSMVENIKNPQHFQFWVFP